MFSFYSALSAASQPSPPGSGAPPGPQESKPRLIIPGLVLDHGPSNLIPGRRGL
jgi:hypothetical protein